LYKRCSNCDQIKGECKCEHPEYMDFLNEEDIQTENEKSTAKKLVEFLEHNISKRVVSKSDSSKVFVLIPINYHVESFDLSSTRIKHWLKSSYYDANEQIHSDEPYKNAIDLILAKAKTKDNTPQELIFNRIAMVDEEIYYDLCSPKWEAVKISKRGVEVVHLGTKTPIFYRSGKHAEQTKPDLHSNRDAISDLLKLLRIPQKYKLIFPIHLISLFIEKYSIPIFALIGEQGSLKSTTSSTIKRILDPSGDSVEDNTNKMSRTSDDLNILLYNKYCSVFDNLSYLTRDTADDLCRGITGQTYQKRTLYTNSDETILTFKRKIILNGISPNLEYPDLLERTIFYQTETIPEDQRLTEEEFNRRFKLLLPELLGQIFKILSKSLQNFERVKEELKLLPRMADFAIWGECISRVIGNEAGIFLQEYKKLQSDTMKDVSGSHATIEYILEKMNGETEIECSVSEFYNNLKDWAVLHNYDTHSKYSNIPKAPNKLLGYLTRVKPLIRNAGYNIQSYAYTGSDGRFTKHAKILKIMKLASPDSPSSLQAQILLPDGEYGGEGAKNLESISSLDPVNLTPIIPISDARTYHKYS